MNDIIPFVIPQKFLSAYETGTVQRFGTLLMQGNRIVGHVQETAPLQRLLTSANPMSFFLNSGSLVSSVTANIQLEQVKHLLSGLQLLSGVTLAASIAGIGVSVVGFTMINKKLNLLTDKLKEMSQQLDNIAKIIQPMDIRQRAREHAQLSALLALGEEAWTRRDQVSIWKNLIDQLLIEDHYYRALLSGTKTSSNIFLEEGFSLNHCILAFENLVTLHAARFQTMFLCRELPAAKHYADELSQWYSTSFDTLSPSDIVTAKSRYYAKEIGGRIEDGKRELLKAAKPFVESVREIQTNMATRPKLIQYLIDHHIDGYDYVKRSRAETEQPILILPDNSSS